MLRHFQFLIKNFFVLLMCTNCTQSFWNVKDFKLPMFTAIKSQTSQQGFIMIGGFGSSDRNTCIHPIPVYINTCTIKERICTRFLHFMERFTEFVMLSRI